MCAGPGESSIRENTPTSNVARREKSRLSGRLFTRLTFALGLQCRVALVRP